MLKLTPELRRVLKKPLSRVIDLDELILEFGERELICVGDQTAESVIEIGLKPKVCVCDGKVARKSIGIPDGVKRYFSKDEKIYIKNPASYLTQEAFDAVRESLSAEKTLIVVDGEEDLITLAAINLAPPDTLVLYGQPGEGLVAVKVDEKIKVKVEGILKRMERV